MLPRVGLDGEVQKRAAIRCTNGGLSPDRSQVIETCSTLHRRLNRITGSRGDIIGRWSPTISWLKKRSQVFRIQLRWCAGRLLYQADEFRSAKKYPVIAYGYGNAGSQMVVNEWGSARGEQRDLWHRYMAEQGFIVFTTDNRTTAGRGKAAYNLTYGEYAKWAIHDQVEGAKYLRSLPFVSEHRFWGWSGGGYSGCGDDGRAALPGRRQRCAGHRSRITGRRRRRWMDQLEDNRKAMNG
jgi:hypothetical protein